MSRLNKIERAVRMWLAFMAMVLPLLSAQAETASELLFTEMINDTITLAYSNDNTNYYLMVGKDNSISACVNSGCLSARRSSSRKHLAIWM